VVSANKGPVVHAYRLLTELAKSRGVKYYFESAVMDGEPIFSLFRSSLPAARLSRFQGVLISTTNMILSRMEQGQSFEQAVAYTQQIGIAETDPSGDIDGWDASVKVAALVTVLMGIPCKPQQVDRQGIRQISSESVLEALRQEKRWKLVCSALRQGDQVLATVRPELVGRDSPMYAAEGTTSIIQFETDVLGRLSIIEENPGPYTTAYGCLADFLNSVVD
jgi:homoserine dehydrogenase